jgi:hypothetical protein
VGWQWRRTDEDDNEMSSLLATDRQKEEEEGKIADFVGLRLDKTGNRAHGYFGLAQALIPGR